MLPLTRNRILFALFFLSGFCSLTYQVVWMRLAFAAFGIITPVMSVVISVFMLGLALGSWGAGRGVRSWTRRAGVSAIHLYAGVEVIIGLSAVVVPPLFRAGQGWLLPLGSMDSPTYLLYSGLLLGASILPWCVAMGATFPLVMEFVKEVDRTETHSFSFLYLANVIGAMAGTLLTAGVLIELLGFRTTLLVGAAVNFGIAAVSLQLGARSTRRTPLPEGEPAAPVRKDRDLGSHLPRGERALVLAILFVTGFCSMGSEVIWVRGFSAILKNLVYSFATLLSGYLFATWLGSWRYRHDLARSRVIPTGALLAGLAVTAWLPIVLNDPRVNDTKLGVLLSILPYCALLGYLTPLLVDRYSSGSPRGGGRAYAVNVVGSILGPLFASYVILPTLGVRYGLALLGVPFLILLLIHWKSPSLAPLLRLSAGAGAAVLALGSVFVSSSYDEGWPEMQGEIRRDYTATVIAYGSGLRKQIMINGVGQTAMTPITKVMAHLPLALLERPPESAAVICFGMGTTFRSLLTWEIEATAVELVKSVPESFSYFHSDAPVVLENPRGTIVVDDGRRYLLRADRRFDVITVDPSPPTEAAGSSLLYSKEFYEIAKRRLEPDGILMQWVPEAEDLTVRAVTRSLVDSFPHVRVLRGFHGIGHHFIASFEPVEIPPADVIVSRLPEAAKRDLVEWNTGMFADVPSFVRMILAREVDPQALLDPDPRVVITDDRPFNEYYLLRRYLPALWSP